MLLWQHRERHENSSCRWNIFVRLQFILGHAVKWPETVTRTCRGPDCPSLTLLTHALFLSDSSYTRIEERGRWHQITCHLTSHAAALIATQMDIFLTPNNRGRREEKKNIRGCCLILGVRPSLLEQASHKLDDFFMWEVEKRMGLMCQHDLGSGEDVGEKWKGLFKYVDVLQPISSMWTGPFSILNTKTNISNLLLITKQILS